MNEKLLLSRHTSGFHLLYFDDTREYVILSLGNEFRVQYCVIKCKQRGKQFNIIINECLFPLASKNSHRPSFVLDILKRMLRQSYNVLLLFVSGEKQVNEKLITSQKT